MDPWKSLEKASGPDQHSYFAYEQLGREMIQKGLIVPAKPPLGGRNLPTSLGAAAIIYAQVEGWIGLMITGIN